MVVFLKPVTTILTQMQSHQAVNVKPSESITGNTVVSIRHTLLCGNPTRFEFSLVLSFTSYY